MARSWTSVPSFPVALPSSLLERRPDVAAAEQTMRQANAEIGVEFAGYFPAVSLNGLVGFSGNPFATEFGPSNPVWSFGGVARAAFVQRRPHDRAGRGGSARLYDADVATYRQTVLTAIQQVEDALAGIRILAREVKVQADNVRISRQATQITLNEYQAGTQAFTAVVTAEAQQLAAEEALLATQGQLQTDAVDLRCRAWRRLELSRRCLTSPAQTSAIPPH